MDEQIVYALIDGWLKELKKRPYDDLVSFMGHPQTKEVTGGDGKNYQLEAEVFWDGKKGGISALSSREMMVAGGHSSSLLPILLWHRTALS